MDAVSGPPKYEAVWIVILILGSEFWQAGPYSLLVGRNGSKMRLMPPITCVLALMPSPRGHPQTIVCQLIFTNKDVCIWKEIAQGLGFTEDNLAQTLYTLYHDSSSPFQGNIIILREFVTEGVTQITCDGIIRVRQEPLGMPVAHAHG
jgi:hypothetical protein